MPPDAGQLPIASGVEPVVPNPTTAHDNVNKHETAHVIFMDIVSFTKLPSVKQKLVLEKLQHIVRATNEYKKYSAGKSKKRLVALPTGDGMALVFLNLHDGSGPAISCAHKIAEAIINYNQSVTEVDSKINVRMGIHSGNVVRISDINNNLNVAGEGINTAQRVMDCGDTGHILLSDRACGLWPDESDRTDQCLPFDIEVKVKHDQKVRMHNFYNGRIGNKEIPKKVLLQKEEALQELRDQETLTKVRAEFEQIERAERSKRKKVRAAVLAFLILVVTVLIVVAGTKEPDKKPSLTILSFKPVTQKNYSKVISRGLTEQFNRSFTNLADLNHLSLVKSTVAQNVAGKTEFEKLLPALETAKRQGVRYVLTGTVEARKDEDDLTDTDFPVEVRVNLYDTQDYKLLWQEDYTPSSAFNQLISLQKEIVQKVVDKIGVPYQETDRQYTKNSKAFWYYIKGRFWSMGRPSNEDNKNNEGIVTKTVRESYQAAIDIDGDYALAHVGLADLYLSTGGISMNPELAKARALEHLVRALNSDENLPEVYASIGVEKCWFERDFISAKTAFLRAIELNPQSADYYKRYSSCLVFFGKKDEADEQIKKALDREPESAYIQFTNGQNYFFAGKYDEAIKQLEKVISNRPDIFGAHRFLALALEQTDQYDKALEHLAEDTKDSDILGARGHILVRMDKAPEAVKIAERLEKLRETEIYVSPFNIALIYAEIPDKEEKAFEWLDKAIKELDPRISWLKVDPRFARLRKNREQKFNERLQNAGLLP